jgi:acetylornithine deacetylase/succinyl-diaminopimelate desuccinylase-like protein
MSSAVMYSWRISDSLGARPTCRDEPDRSPRHVDVLRAADLLPRIDRLMPQLTVELEALVAHRSIAFDGYPREPVVAAGRAVLELVKRAGFAEAVLIDLGGSQCVYADVPGPPGSPTVLLYAHYDVQPAPMEAGWRTDPWTLTERDGRLYGRGAADDKSGIIIHAATMRLLEGRPPARLRLVIEGDEEAGSSLEKFVDGNPEKFRADVYVSADDGNLVAGQPALETTLRGDVMCDVTTRTLRQSVHSGVFGGAAPDALVALIHVLAGLWNEAGELTVSGLQQFEWQGAEFPADLLRTAADVLPDVELAGGGSVASRLWSRPSATVLGLDAPSVAASANVLIPSARARVGLRIAPGADPEVELGRLMQLLRARAPRWASVDVTPWGTAAEGFEAPQSGPAIRAARTALREVYGLEPTEVGGGGGIPLMRTLQRWSPDAEFILWGAQDLVANAHGPNESVDPEEIKKIVASEILLLDRLAPGTGRT